MEFYTINIIVAPNSELSDYETSIVFRVEIFPQCHPKILIDFIKYLKCKTT